MTQRFVNNADGPVEATFVFKHDEAAVYGFEADIGGRKTVGEVQEKEAAFEAYSDAIAARDTGALPYWVKKGGMGQGIVAGRGGK